MDASKFNELLSKYTGLVCITGMGFPPWLFDPMPSPRPRFLFPEERRNVDEQAAFISEIEEGVPNLIVVTRSAFIISDFRREQVLIFEGDKVVHPEFETFGASVNKITMCLFGRRATVGDRALKVLESLSSRLEKGENPSAIIDEASTLGDSVEKVLFMKVALNKEEELNRRKIK